MEFVQVSQFDWSESLKNMMAKEIEEKKAQANVTKSAGLEQLRTTLDSLKLMQKVLQVKINVTF